jgi:hypothetical protein
MSYTIDKIIPFKPDWDNKWTVTSDLRGLETFDMYESNYDIVDKLKEVGILKAGTEEDSEFCQFFAYFSSKKSAESFIKRLGKYVEERKRLINSL